jgi:Zn finger protein HypA/HybF involved in hydrogenase expression
MPTANIDPYESSGSLFECVECGGRVEAESNPGKCDGCGGEVRNLSVHQE